MSAVEGGKSAARMNWLPSNKWWSATVIGAAGVGTAWATAGHWTQTLTVAAIGYVAQRLVAYFTPNGNSTESTYGTG